MGTKSLRLFLDACTIVCAHEINRWEAIISRCRIVVPSTVVRESKYFDDTPEAQHRIVMADYVKSGRIQEVEASDIELEELLDSLGPVRKLFLLGKGEHEALALMLSGSLSDYSFCTADAAAIQAATVLGLRQRLISLEQVLETIGQSTALPKQYGDEFVRKHIAVGAQLRIRYGMTE